jgi:hypothetical protein
MAADASAADGALRAGFEGTEQLITVLFVDLRRSSLLLAPRCPMTSYIFSISFSTK